MDSLIIIKHRWSMFSQGRNEMLVMVLSAMVCSLQLKNTWGYCNAVNISAVDAMKAVFFLRGPYRRNLKMSIYITSLKF